MRASKGVKFAIVLLLLECVLCEVIVREANKNAGSLCFLKDGGMKGVCRPGCPGQRRREYVGNVCNPGETTALYCCVDHTSQQRYTTIHEVCFHRRLIEEFEERGRHVANNLNANLEAMKSKYEERVQEATDWCHQTAETKSEDEREYYLKHCLTIPQQPGTSIRAEHFGRRYNNAHVAGIGFLNPDTSISWLCSGIFIHPKYILTSAFCMLTNEPNIVRTGSSDLNEEDGINYNITGFVVHSEHGVDGGLYHDLAILRVEPYPNQGKHDEVLPACIWTGQSPQHVRVMGYWGLSTRPTRRGHFFDGNITFIEADQCNRQESFNPGLPEGIIKSQLCARESATEENSCLGELGGALYFTEDGWLKIPYIVGVGSFGASCIAGEPSVYTLTTPYIDWIESVISYI